MAVKHLLTHKISEDTGVILFWSKCRVGNDPFTKPSPISDIQRINIMKCGNKYVYIMRVHHGRPLIPIILIRNMSCWYNNRITQTHKIVLVF